MSEPTEQIYADCGIPLPVKSTTLQLMISLLKERKGWLSLHSVLLYSG